MSIRSINLEKAIKLGLRVSEAPKDIDVRCWKLEHCNIATLKASKQVAESHASATSKPANCTLHMHDSWGWGPWITSHFTHAWSLSAVSQRQQSAANKQRRELFFYSPSVIAHFDALGAMEVHCLRLASQTMQCSCHFASVLSIQTCTWKHNNCTLKWRPACPICLYFQLGYSMHCPTMVQL